MRPTSTTKDLKEGIIRCFMKKFLKRGVHRENMCGQPIYEETSSGKGITPKVKRKGGMRK
jgi:hypothetical protein